MRSQTLTEKDFTMENDNRDTSRTQKIRIVCISDTHNAAPGEGYTLPKGDVLIHAGDLTNNGQPSELNKALTWLREAKYDVKIVVAGNHDLALDKRYGSQLDEAVELRRALKEDGEIIYLEHESVKVTVKGAEVSIFGSPFSIAAGERQWAFQYPASQAESLWSAIPSDTAILVTHTPPIGHLDASGHWTRGGCPALLGAVLRTKPLLHVCGHCHEGRGGRVIRWKDEAEDEHGVSDWRDPGAGNRKQSLFDLTKSRLGYALRAGEETAILNASIMAKSYGRGAKAFNKPVVVDVELPAKQGLVALEAG
jgi:Icc-related predicted phosphoesterase